MTITARIKKQPRLTAGFKNLVVTSGDAAAYSGPYEAIPRAFSETILKTQNKVMSKDVRVLEIPYFEVGNENNGKTVYIGGESEIL